MNQSKSTAPENEADETAEAIASHNWSASTPVPWDLKNLYFFVMPAVEFYQAVPLKLPRKIVETLRRVLCQFSYLVTCMGLHESTHRVSRILGERAKEQGKDASVVTPGMLWLKALLITHLVAKAISTLSHQLTLHTSSVRANSDVSSDVKYPLSPLHLWAIHEAMDYLRRDIFPILERHPESKPFPGIESLAQDAAALQEIVAPMLEAFQEHHPYDYLSDAESTLKDAESLLKEAEQSTP